jgi:arylsulfatase A-like enzyme
MDRAKEVRQVQDHPVYAGMMEAMDDAVGLVLDALEENGLAENTVVVFTSDNGGVSSGDGFSTSCLPFRGGKGRQWEGGIRQPLYIHWPGVTRSTTTHVPAVGTDFFPTLLEIAGLPLPSGQPMDGVSLVPVLRGGTLPQRSLYWHYPHYGNQGGDPSAIVMRGPWKLIHYFDGARNELYHVERDLGEQRDLVKEDPGRVESMAKELFAWMADVGARKPSTNPKYDSEQYARDLKKVREVGVPKREEQHAAFLERQFTPSNGWWEHRGGGTK